MLLKYPTEKARLDPDGMLTGLMEIVVHCGGNGDKRYCRDVQVCAEAVDGDVNQRWDLYYWNRAIDIELRQR